MPVLTLPNYRFVSSQFGIESNVATFESIFTKSGQTVEWPGAKWWAQLVLPPIKDKQSGPWRALLAKLRGGAGRIYVGDPDYAVSGPQGTALGAGVVNGANQVGTTLVTSGWTPSQAKLFSIGDYIAFNTSAGRELKMVSADVASDASGNASIPIEPPIRVSPSHSQAIIVSQPSCIMRLVDPRCAWDSDRLRYQSITLDLIEAL